MATESNELPKLPRLGELFVEAGIVKPHVIAESLALAKRTHLPVGRVLVMSGYVRERDVDSALQTQQLIKDGKATRESASRMLRAAHCQKISVKDAESQESCQRAFSMPFSHVGRMLLAAHIVSEKFLLVATRESCHLRMPLGRYLVTKSAMSEDVLIAVFNCMILVRDKKISRMQAVSILRTTHQEKASDIRNALVEHSCSTLIQDAPRLCDLFVASKVLTKSEATWALEMSLETAKMIGQILLESNLIDETLLESSLQLQRMHNEKTLKLQRAADLLALCDQLRAPLEAVLTEIDKLNEVVEFMRKGKIFDERKMREVAASSPDFQDSIGAAFLRHKLVNPRMLQIASVCLEYFRTSALTEKQAIDAYKISIERAISPQDAIRYINWDMHNLHGENELLGKTA